MLVRGKKEERYAKKFGQLKSPGGSSPVKFFTAHQ